MTYQLRALNTRQTNPNLVEWLNIAGHQTRTNRSPERDGNLSSNQRAPSYDLRQTPSQIEIKLAMPGVSPENLEVTIERRRLTISGRAETDASNDSSQLLHQGCILFRDQYLCRLREDVFLMPCSYPFTSRPIDRAEPSMISIAASISFAFRSFIFASAISLT